MLKHTLVTLVLALAQTGCNLEEEGNGYDPVSLTDESRQRLEGYKREFLTNEDIKLGYGPLAAWGRKTRADIEVCYTDGTVAYRGPIYDYVGFHASVFILDADKEPGGLVGQSGIWLGINGMAVGGKRRITMQTQLVCGGDINPPNWSCLLTKPDINGKTGLASVMKS